MYEDSMVVPEDDNRLLKVLDLSGSLIGDIGIEKVANDLLRCRNLVSLQLDDIGLGDSGVHLLSKALRTSPVLESVSLRHNKIGDDGCMDLANQLFRPDYSSISQPVFNISTYEHLCPLKELNISFNKIHSMDAMLDLLMASVHQPLFRKLEFHGNSDSYDEVMNNWQGITILNDIQSTSNRSDLQKEAFYRDLPVSCEYGCDVVGLTRGTKHTHRCHRALCIRCKSFKLGDHDTTVYNRGFVCKRCDSKVETLCCCELCERMIDPALLLDHIEFECVERLIQCDYPGCSESLPYYLLENHIKIQHYKSFKKQLITRNVPLRDQPGDVNKFASKLMKDVSHISALLSSKSPKEEAKNIKHQLTEIKVAQSVERKRELREALQIWHTFLQRDDPHRFNHLKIEF